MRVAEPLDKRWLVVAMIVLTAVVVALRDTAEFAAASRVRGSYWRTPDRTSPSFRDYVTRRKAGYAEA